MPTFLNSKKSINAIREFLNGRDGININQAGVSVSNLFAQSSANDVNLPNGNFVSPHALGEFQGANYTNIALSGSVSSGTSTSSFNGPWRVWPGNFAGNIDSALSSDGGYSPGDPIELQVVAKSTVAWSGNRYFMTYVISLPSSINPMVNYARRLDIPSSAAWGYNDPNHSRYQIPFPVRTNSTALSYYNLTNNPIMLQSLSWLGAKTIASNYGFEGTGGIGGFSLEGVHRIRKYGTITTTTYTLTISNVGISTWKWGHGGTLSSAISASTTTATVPSASGITVYGYDSSGNQVINISI